MNCKPGDLAVIVKGLDYGKEHIGKIVRVKSINYRWSDCWDYEGEVLCFHGMKIDSIEDECLMPIRPDESTEESTEAMRLLTQLPQKEKV